MQGYCQDRAIMWLSRSFSTPPGEAREAYLELAFLYEQMGLLADLSDRLAGQLGRGRIGGQDEPVPLVAENGSR
ncbi:MAG: hypothetical protein J0I52_03400 [Bordetella sp.]|nr:hypothetical protein [Bordetella sp.]